MARYRTTAYFEQEKKRMSFLVFFLWLAAATAAGLGAYAYFVDAKDRPTWFNDSIEAASVFFDNSYRGLVASFHQDQVRTP